MPSTVTRTPVTRGVYRLHAFCTGLFGATETVRVPEERPAFYVGLRIGGSDLGLSADAAVAVGAPVRVLHSSTWPT